MSHRWCSVCAACFAGADLVVAGAAAFVSADGIAVCAAAFARADVVVVGEVAYAGSAVVSIAVAVAGADNLSAVVSFVSGADVVVVGAVLSSMPLLLTQMRSPVRCYCRRIFRPSELFVDVFKHATLLIGIGTITQRRPVSISCNISSF